MSNQAPPPLGQQLASLLEPAQLMLWAMSRKYNAELTAFDLLLFDTIQLWLLPYQVLLYLFSFLILLPYVLFYQILSHVQTFLSSCAYRHNNSTLILVPRFRRLIFYLDTQCTQHTNTRNKIQFN